jgi:sirohydrochlorin cobaltochelatase
MNGRALVLAAHGSAEPTVNDGVVELARRAGRRLGFDEAIAAFHRGDPSFSRALDALRSDDVVVVPLLQSEGYYCHRVLPTELAKNSRFGSLRVRQTRAVGVHPALGDVLARRVRELRAEHRLEQPAVALVGHGTPRHRGSREAAEASAADLERRTGLLARAFFLDEAPPVDAIHQLAPGRDLIVLPLLIGAGRHATQDLSRRLGEPRGGGKIVIDRPVGLDPAIEEIVVALAGAW